MGLALGIGQIQVAFSKLDYTIRVLVARNGWSHPAIDCCSSISCKKTKRESILRLREEAFEIDPHARLAQHAGKFCRIDVKTCTLISAGRAARSFLAARSTASIPLSELSNSAGQARQPDLQHRSQQKHSTRRCHGFELQPMAQASRNFVDEQSDHSRHGNENHGSVETDF